MEESVNMEQLQKQQFTNYSYVSHSAAEKNTLCLAINCIYVSSYYTLLWFSSKSEMFYDWGFQQTVGM